MKIFEFNKYFPDEAACRRKFKEMRDKEGVTCQHCGSHDVVWLESKQQYQCKHCRHRTTLFADVYHGIKPEFLQEYLNEFCYKFNRRYFGEDLFERLVMIAASYRTDFEHKTYRKVA